MRRPTRFASLAQKIQRAKGILFRVVTRSRPVFLRVGKMEMGIELFAYRRDFTPEITMAASPTKQAQANQSPSSA